MNARTNIQVINGPDGALLHGDADQQQSPGPLRTPAAPKDLVRHHGIHRFTVNWVRMQKRRKADRDREENNPKHGQAKVARLISLHIHHYAD